ncbi:hypothetical protein AHAS_Ahas11G0200800 [Arachis hypogaea]
MRERRWEETVSCKPLTEKKLCLCRRVRVVAANAAHRRVTDIPDSSFPYVPNSILETYYHLYPEPLMSPLRR